MIRIVSTEQLTKEREAQARVEEAKRKAEIETRTKLAEAAAQGSRGGEPAGSRRRRPPRRPRLAGPLREEVIRLSYADPEEVAKTLQGILGIPPRGHPARASGSRERSRRADRGGVPRGPSPEPPFSAALSASRRAPARRGAAGVVSVSQDVLAKGLTIRAHKPTNSIFIRLYEADLERIKKLIRE